MEVSVVIPNFNGIAFLDSVLASLEGQTLNNFEVILVDNGSTDGSCSFVTANYPWVHLIELSENFGFCGAVNAGIRAAKAPYVLLLNNDTEVKADFVEEMLAAIRRHKNAFSCGARMVQYMIATNWMMSAIITVHWDGLLPAAEGKISMHMRQKTGFFPHVPVQQSTAKKFSRR